MAKILTTLTLLLTLGVGQMWADHKASHCGFWDNGGIELNWSLNGSSRKTTLNYNGIDGTYTGTLGTVTTSLTLSSTVVHIWRDYAYGNICSSTVYWELYKGSSKIDEGNYSPATWGSWSGSNNTMTYSTSQDFLAKTTGPANYTLRVYAKITGQNSDSKYDNPSYLGCGTSWWYNNNTSNGYYSITFTIPSKNLTVAGAGSGNTVSGSVTGITKGTAYTITATPTTGYTFGGWTKTSGGSSITIADASSATTTVTFSNYSTNATVTATFNAEETHDVTVYYKYGSTTVKTETTETGVGVTTERSFSAPDVDGYNFYSYTFGSGLTMKSANTTTNPCRFVTKASGDYKLTTNYNIAPVKLLYGTSTPLNSPSNTAMTYDATNKAYYVDVTTSASPYYFRFDFNNNTQEYAGAWNTYPDVNAVAANGAKVTCATEVKGWGNKSSLKFTGISGSSIRIWFSYKDRQAWITEATYTVTITNDGHGTTTPATVTAGKNTLSGNFTASDGTGYYFYNWTKTSGSVTITNATANPTTTKATAASTIRANFKPKWSLAGGEVGGSNWATDAYKQTTYSENTRTHQESHQELTLEPNTTYWIKMYDLQNSSYYGLASGASNDNVYYPDEKVWRALVNTSGNKNIYVHTAAQGTYNFYWECDEHNMFIEYPASVRIYLGQNDALGGSVTAVDNDSYAITNSQYAKKTATVTFTAAKNTGYTFDGWFSESDCLPAHALSAIDDAGHTVAISDNVLTFTGKTYDEFKAYAKFTPKNYNVALDMQSGAEGYGSGSNRNETVTYNTTLTTVGSLPTAANGYAFMGFYTATGGRGTQFIDASGNWVTSVTDTISDGKWVLDAGATLYAYYKKAEITNVAISPSTMVAPATELTITPTVSPTPTGTTKLCYYVLHNGGSMVDPQPAMTLTSTNAKLTLPGTSGTYKIAVTLRTGSDCGGGTLLDSVVTNVVIASDHTVTIKYLCDGEPVKASTTISGKPLAWSSSFTPGDDPFGYTFVEWRAGDGVTISTNGSTAISGSTTSTRTIYIKANYDGVLTAVYRQRGIIYFKKPSDWSSSSSVYYYNIGSSGKWKDSGEGKYGLYTNGITYGGQAMTRIGTSNIYYYDYEATGTTSDDPGQYIAFSNQLQNGYEPMNACQVSWPIEYTKGFNTGTPMFVCANYRYHQWLADYYNGGYWTKYHPDWSEDDYTGYTLKIYNQKASSGRKELKSVKFTSTSEDMTYKAVVELEAGQTYGFKFVRDDGMYYKNDKDGTLTYSNRNDYWPFVFDGSDGDACGLTTTATGFYTFTMAYYENSHDIRINVSYPVADNDYRLIYKDNNHTNWHPSANISKRNNAKDTVSFFVRKDKNPVVKIQKASVNASTGAVTWSDYTGTNLLASIPSVISDKSDYGVFNFNLQTNGSGAMSLESIDEYTGEYYIRTDNVTNKWDSYKNADHMMTYTEFSENRETNTFGPLYSHYFCHWCECGTNIKFTVANDYSPCISDTLTVGEFNNTDASGTLKTDSDPATDNTSDIYSANIRFMWNRKTNEIGRAYVASATTAARQFLVLKGCNTIKNSDGSSLSGTGESAAENRAIFKDNQDWIYERMIQIQPGTHAKLYACYAKNPIDVSTAQYFRGAYDSGNCSNEESSTNSIQIIGGSGSSFYVVRVIYDFKTNRLITAWMPNGTDITSNVEVDADVMVIRDHQEAAECITFSESGKLSKVKTVYGVMKFNRWTLNNRYRGKGGIDDQDPDHCKTAAAISEYHGVLPTADQKSSHERGSYFVSFPFDVKLSEVFGFGTYGTHWIISTYNGARRAQRGFFYDNCVNEDCTNWDYVIESEGYNPKTFVMEKYKGYLLQLDLDLMEYDNTAFWTNNISQKELYFPSQVAMESITSTEATMPALDDEQYLCTINHDIPKGSNPEGDRRMKDSYWRCIGVPSYATYGAVLKKDNSSGATITWNSDRTWKANVKNYPFLYEWNPEDNTISVRATSRYEFKPMHAYLVQNGNAIYWSAVSATPASIVKRVYEEEDKEYLWEIELQYNNKVADRTYLRLSNDELITDTFDLNQDMIKEFNNSRSNIYTFIGIEKAAANSRNIHSEETTIVPLGLVIKRTGEYTISIPDGTNGVGITLIDEETGIRTSLSALDYTVNLAAGDYTERFWLEISPVKGAETGIDPGVDARENGVRKVMIDGLLYIVRDGKMFDATGKRVE